MNFTKELKLLTHHIPSMSLIHNMNISKELQILTPDIPSMPLAVHIQEY